jgi:farnesyl-diphosphate farnesyltransferase
VFEPYRRGLPDVSLKLAQWANHSPAEIAPRIWADTAAMADRMAHWASVNWRIRHVEDLNAYTFSVAAGVGLLMCDILAWHDGTQMNRSDAIAFGRGLQLTNIARNRREDLERGADFYPPGWNDADMRAYASCWLQVTSDYSKTLPPKAFSYFIKIPLALAEATIQTLAEGKPKLTRETVMAIVGQV